jgi:hypothetical protein
MTLIHTHTHAIMFTIQCYFVAYLFCSASNRTQGLVHARLVQALSCITSPICLFKGRSKAPKFPISFLNKEMTKINVVYNGASELGDCFIFFLL